VSLDQRIEDKIDALVAEEHAAQSDELARLEL